MSQQNDKKAPEKKQDSWDKNGYFHWKHAIDGIEMVFYLQNSENTSWVHAFEGAFDFATMFKQQIYKLKREAAEKQSKEKKDTESASDEAK